MIKINLIKIWRTISIIKIPIIKNIGWNLQINENKDNEMFIKKMNKSKQRINKYNTFEDKFKLIIIIIIRYISFHGEQIIKIIISLNNFFQNNSNIKIIHSYIFHNYSNNKTKNFLNYNIIKN